LLAANDNSPAPSRLYVTDRNTKTKYLVDTGSDVSVFPQTLVCSKRRPEAYELFAANGTPIITYGSMTIKPDFSLRRAFPWKFIIADVRQPIIGSDFLAYYDLLPDMKRGKLIDRKTGLTTTGTRCYNQVFSIKTVVKKSEFHTLLTEFPDITNPTKRKEVINHGTQHHIQTTPGQPEASRPRRLAPDRLQAAKTEFDLLL